MAAARTATRSVTYASKDRCASFKARRAVVRASIVAAGSANLCWLDRAEATIDRNCSVVLRRVL
jgi:hypothetical protein